MSKETELHAPTATPPKAPADVGANSTRQRIKDGLFALSLANLILIGTWFPLLFDADSSYYNQLPVSAVSLLALLANFTWLALTCWLTLRFLRRTANHLVAFVIHLVFFGLLLMPGEFIRYAVLEIPDYQVVAFLRRPWTGGSVFVLVLIGLWQHRRLARGAGTLVGILSPLALLTLGRVLLLLLGVTHLRQSGAEPELAPRQTPPPDMPRVVWIIFDELDQRLAFSQRPADVALPEFDRLRAESVYATNAYPPGGSTLVSMPALISGWPVRNAEVSGPSDLTLTGPQGEQVRWSELPSVFSRAIELGANTGLIGWYHPYSRVLGASLNDCAWFPYPKFEPTRALTFQLSAERQLRNTLPAFHLRRLFADLCQQGQREATFLAANPGCNLMLLHLAPPHKPGIYLPETDRYTVFGMPKVKGYFNNLALADRSLGEIRRAIVESGAGDRTWIILSSDHWWRESAHYDGRTDERVPFLVRPPTATAGQVYGGLLNTIITGDLALAILRREVRTGEAVATWLDGHRLTKPPTYNQRSGSE